MIALLLCGIIAGACAAPQFEFSFGPPRHRPYFSNFDTRLQPYADDNVFDTGRFWSDLSKELKELDDMLADFSRRFPTSVSQEGVEGTEYKVTISLPDFEEKDIVVKAREGLLMIQANHKYSEGSERNYLDVRTLPDTVNVTGNWIFEHGVLKITFPLKDGVVVKTTEVAAVTEQQPELDTTVRPYFEGSREEIETNVNDVQDADVGLGRGDLDKDNEVRTNEIADSNTVEATTYAVDLKDEIEFVPVRY
ncbi:hypothetical protein PYW07_007522 [Mythimna separata]|uniref:Heat shock protein 27.2 n=1 Tax=Mythimna separata TaxID=271217 RepID=A0A2D1CRQ8_MYTSE|nr:heat shock protein 27.2 [Mythimna separata]KAJ8735902.1 hypothetical protein PYW07_007522 [Mythimna separata]